MTRFARLSRHSIRLCRTRVALRRSRASRRRRVARPSLARPKTVRRAQTVRRGDAPSVRKAPRVRAAGARDNRAMDGLSFGKVSGKPIAGPLAGALARCREARERRRQRARALRGDARAGEARAARGWSGLRKDGVWLGDMEKKKTSGTKRRLMRGAALHSSRSSRRGARPSVRWMSVARRRARSPTQRFFGF